MAISQSITSGTSGYIQSLVFRRQWLKQLKLSAVKNSKTEIIDLDAEVSDRFRREPASTHEAALWLSYMAVDFRNELSWLISDLGNLHRGRVVGVADSLNLFLSDAEAILRAYSSRHDRLDKLSDAAKGIASSLDTLQSNLPVWNLARGLQLFLLDCKELKIVVA